MSRDEAFGESELRLCRETQILTIIGRNGVRRWLARNSAPPSFAERTRFRNCATLIRRETNVNTYLCAISFYQQHRSFGSSTSMRFFQRNAPSAVAAAIFIFRLLNSETSRRTRPFAFDAFANPINVLEKEKGIAEASPYLRRVCPVVNYPDLVTTDRQSGRVYVAIGIAFPAGTQIFRRSSRSTLVNAGN